MTRMFDGTGKPSVARIIMEQLAKESQADVARVKARGRLTPVADVSRVAKTSKRRLAKSSRTSSLLSGSDEEKLGVS